MSQPGDDISVCCICGDEMNDGRVLTCDPCAIRMFQKAVRKGLLALSMIPDKYKPLVR